MMRDEKLILVLHRFESYSTNESMCEDLDISDYIIISRIFNRLIHLQDIAQYQLGR